MELTKRKKEILSYIIQSYIEVGEPISSKAIAEQIGVSSATVRNEMVELTYLGLLRQPHTSAGRIPSQNGYREYIDHVMCKPELTEQKKMRIEAELNNRAYDAAGLLPCAADALANYTKCISVVSKPNQKEDIIKALQFVQTSRRTAMLVMLLSSGAVLNRMFHCDFDLTSEILRVLFRVFNEKIAGKTVSDIHLPFIQTLGASISDISILATPAIAALLELANDAMKAEHFVSGEPNLFFHQDILYEEVRGILEWIAKEENLERMLMRKKGSYALIGNEIGHRELRNCTVLVSCYRMDGRETGKLAVLGPLRMDYQDYISVIEYIAESVGEKLTVLMNQE